MEYPLFRVLDFTLLNASSSFNIAAIPSSLNSKSGLFSISSCKNSVKANPPSSVLVRPAIPPYFTPFVNPTAARGAPPTANPPTPPATPPATPPFIAPNATLGLSILDTA